MHLLTLYEYFQRKIYEPENFAFDKKYADLNGSYTIDVFKIYFLTNALFGINRHYFYLLSGRISKAEHPVISRTILYCYPAVYISTSASGKNPDIRPI